MHNHVNLYRTHFSRSPFALVLIRTCVCVCVLPPAHSTTPSSAGPSPEQTDNMKAEPTSSVSPVHARHIFPRNTNVSYSAHLGVFGQTMPSMRNKTTCVQRERASTQVLFLRCDAHRLLTGSCRRTEIRRGCDQ